MSDTTRREMLGLLAGAGLALIACDDGDGAGESPTLDGGAVDAASDPDVAVGLDLAVSDAAVDAGQPDAAVDATSPDATPDPDMAPAADTWAAGGTASMRDVPSYPDPFLAGVGAACVIVADTTRGPCTTEAPADREDISEGWTGLPMRLGLRVVDTNCAPLIGAIVSVWHTNVVGSYSGQTPRNDFCLLDQQYARSDFFRGVRRTDERGVVWFTSCFPGWYPGRAIHIHFEITHAGQTTRISQLTFDEPLIEAVFAEHPDYVEFGQPDTTLRTDGVYEDLSAAELAALTLDVARMPDGAMQAWKTITVT